MLSSRPIHNQRARAREIKGLISDCGKRHMSKSKLLSPGKAIFSMPRKGRELETLVALIERVLSPTGAAVRSPDYLQDRITGERREVDISIRSKVGSVELLLICECRDRASVQDVTWIEQIAQKRKDVGASKAVAISSSAFTEPALKKARFLGIDTRLVRDLSAEAISDWFTVGVLTLSTIHADVVHASFNIARYIGQ